MYKKYIYLLFILTFTFALTSCTEHTEYKRFQSNFIGLFDTHSIILGYAENEQLFTEKVNIIYNELERAFQLFDIYNEYEGINNLKTVNDNAGIAPVTVDKDIIELIKASKQAYEDTNGAFNIALGPVLKIWHEHRSYGKLNPDLASLPDIEVLQEAKKYIHTNNIVIDEENNTIFLTNENMSLDVGGIGKGYAIELATQKAYEIGLESLVISIGGDVHTLEKPLDANRDTWAIGVQDPNLQIDGNKNILDTVFANNTSVFSSGNYQRYYIVDGEVYHHIIDPSTLMPANGYKSVSIIHPNPTRAEILSTALFILTIEDGMALLEKLGGEALWILNDDTVVKSTGYDTFTKQT